MSKLPIDHGKFTLAELEELIKAAGFSFSDCHSAVIQIYDWDHETYLGTYNLNDRANFLHSLFRLKYLQGKEDGKHELRTGLKSILKIT